eukprot:TRINITY_DN14172_c0_g1_i1.p1 TRINITY_DN14172_c0_g1~~TRINITY_DN14172_c0_g1_i1.p1  ORF type:complete len:409 (+),score=53.84 TRINITY_DN14172_c0_g1_i1:63-1289(+)
MSSMNEVATPVVASPAHPSIEGYAIRGTLGYGRYGRVYRAIKEEVLAEDHVVAEFAIKAYSVDEDGHNSEDRERRYLREVHFLKLVQGHANVVALHASVDTAKAIVMSLYTRDLHALVHKRNGLSESLATHVMRGLLKAVQHVHKQGVIHRDIKPENIAVHGPDNDAVLIDFDIASSLSDAVAMKEKRGTPGYMAPEVIMGAPYGTKADVFSIGGVMYYLFAKKNPFVPKQYSDNAAFRKTLLGLKSFDPRFDEVGFACKQLILLLLSVMPRERPSVKDALRHYWFVADNDSCSAPCRIQVGDQSRCGSMDDVSLARAKQAHSLRQRRNRSVAKEAQMDIIATRDGDAFPVGGNLELQPEADVVQQIGPVFPLPPVHSRQGARRPSTFCERANSRPGSSQGTPCIAAT